MKKLFLLPLVMLATLAGFVSCTDEEDIPQIDVPATAMAKFQSMYPGVEHISWDRHSDYYVAEFVDAGVEKEAWYDVNGKWAMTESDYGKNASVLPAPVAAAIAEYTKYVIDDIELYERPADTFYLIELDSKVNTDLYVFYAPDGTLINKIPDIGRDYKILPISNIVNL